MPSVQADNQVDNTPSARSEGKELANMIDKGSLFNPRVRVNIRPRPVQYFLNARIPSSRARAWLCCPLVALLLSACDWPATAPSVPDLSGPCDPLETNAKAMPQEDTLEAQLEQMQLEHYFLVFLEYKRDYRVFALDIEDIVWRELQVKKVLVDEPKKHHKSTLITYLNLQGERSVLAYKREPQSPLLAGFAATDQSIKSIEALQSVKGYTGLKRSIKGLMPRADNTITTELPRDLRFLGEFAGDHKLLVVNAKDEAPGLYLGQGEALQGAKDVQVEEENDGQVLRFRFTYDGKPGTLSLPGSVEADQTSQEQASSPRLTLDGKHVELDTAKFQPDPEQIEDLAFQYCERAHGGR